MEEKKLDVNSLIGFGLIFVILIYMFYINQPTPEELAAKQQAEREAAAIQESSSSSQEADYTQAAQSIQDINPTDSTAVAAYKSSMGAFSFTPIVPGNTLIENDVLRVEVSHKGGQLVLAQNKKYNTYDSVPVYLIKDGNATFNISFTTQDNRIIQTKNLYFEPFTSSSDQGSVLSMKAKISDTEYLLFEYSLPKDGYMLDFKIKSVGLSGFFNPTQDPELQWDLKTIRHSKSVQYENRYTRLNYKFEEDKLDKLSDSSDDDATEQAVEWVSYSSTSSVRSWLFLLHWRRLVSIVLILLKKNLKPLVILKYTRPKHLYN